MGRGRRYGRGGDHYLPKGTVTSEYDTAEKIVNSMNSLLGDLQSMLNIAIYNDIADVPYMQDEASAHLAIKRDALTESLYICTNSLGETIVASPNSSFELASIWHNRKKYEEELQLNGNTIEVVTT